MKVSVLMLTYNHKRFIGQAVESALMQVTDFDWELVIGEDCSTDGTRRTLIQFAERHPQRIRCLLHERNLGMAGNFASTFKACRGEYVAFLEGDDYWISPHKLQKQVLYLDSNPEYAICFHNARLVDCEDRLRRDHLCGPNQKPTSTIEDILTANFIPTCSAMFRRASFPDIPPWFHDLKIIDWPLHVVAARQGKIGYLNEVMAVYRLHDGGCFSASSQIDQQEAVLEAYQKLDEHLGFQYERLIREGMFRCWHSLAVACDIDGRRGASRSYAKLCLRSRPFHRQLLLKAKLLLRILGPRLYSIGHEALQTLRMPIRGG